MQLNNQLQLHAILKEQKRQKTERLNKELQVRLVSLGMFLTAFFVVMSILKI
jgi:hypothetical protein